MLKRLSHYHLRDHMNETMKATMEVSLTVALFSYLQVMQQLMPLLELIDEEVYNIISKSGTPIEYQH